MIKRTGISFAIVLVGLMVALAVGPAWALVTGPMQIGGGGTSASGEPPVVTPMVINYQGYLTDNTGTALDGPVNITFAIYNVPSGGTALWTETQTVTLTDGLFTVLLGSVTPIDPATDLTGTSYLGVTVAGDSELAPRERIASNAYAMVASEAQNANLFDNMDSDQFVLSSGDTMTGPLTVQGMIQSTAGGFMFPDGTTQTTANAGGSGGSDGLNCWDLNTNGSCDLPTEDTNGDTICDAADCQGPEGPMGPQGPQGPQGHTGAMGQTGPAGTDGLNCWDLNANSTCDLATEDTNTDGICDTADCQGPQGPTGPQGSAGTTVPGLQGPPGPEGGTTPTPYYIGKVIFDSANQEQLGREIPHQWDGDVIPVYALNQEVSTPFEPSSGNALLPPALVDFSITVLGGEVTPYILACFDQEDLMDVTINLWNGGIHYMTIQAEDFYVAGIETTTYPGLITPLEKITFTRSVVAQMWWTWVEDGYSVDWGDGSWVNPDIEYKVPVGTAPPYADGYYGYSFNHKVYLVESVALAPHIQDTFVITKGMGPETLISLRALFAATTGSSVVLHQWILDKASGMALEFLYYSIQNPTVKRWSLYADIGAATPLEIVEFWGSPIFRTKLDGGAEAEAHFPKQ